MITSYRETDTFSQLEWILMRIQVKTWCILSEGVFFLPREKTETILKMNLLSVFCHQEICLSPHLLYFFVWIHWVYEPSLSLKERSLKITYGVCVPTKPDKLILLSWYNFRGHKGHIPKPVKIDRSSANLVQFGQGWKWNLSLSISLQVILFSFRILPYIGYLALRTCCFEILQGALFLVCGGLN